MSSSSVFRAATTALSGVVDTLAQSFAGVKTFTSAITASGGFTADSGAYATASVPGLVSTLAQTFAGTKSFVNNTCVRALRSGSNQALSSSGSTTMVFNSVGTDRNSEYNSSTGIFTAAVAGVYHFSTGIATTSATCTRIQITFVASVAGNHTVHDSPTGVTAIRHGGGSVTLPLAAGETVYVSAFTTGTSPVADTGSFLSIAKVA